MPSPFPGMDPYLESPVHWEGLHQILITFMTSALNAALPAEFMARVGERLYVIEPDKIVPDISVLRRGTPPEAGTAVAEPVADAPLRIYSAPDTAREPYIEIVTVRQGGRVVTAIELLSPSNKANGSSGREEYRRKQRQLIDSDTHLLEIDLLRGGAHTVAVQEMAVAFRAARWDYIACLHRAGDGNNYDVWPRTVRDGLPRLLVPLTPGLPDVGLPLQAAFDRAYDEGAFARAVDYRADPEPPLAAEDTDWADALLRERGAR